MELRSEKMIPKIKKDDSSRNGNQENVKENDDKQSQLPVVNLIEEVPDGKVNNDLSKLGSLTGKKKKQYY
uniref:Uncharacterized protein n=1 Tax=Strongyloides venezuelensis TaxID=75913 RepID=A0A0K0EX87_STRVS